jgi:pimeloyl-ACP methyl ester carboxylesterase
MMSPTMHSRRISLATGLTYHVLEWNPESPRTVILLHGFLDHAWGWEPVVEAGLGDVHVVAPDMRGHGDSDRVGAGGYYYFADYLADLNSLISILGRRPVALVGHSMGSSIASYYAGAFPDEVRRLALLEGLGPPEHGALGPERVAAWLGAWRRVRERPQRSYASVDEAAARLCEHDPLLEAALARRLAEQGTARGDDGRLRFKHDPLHATPGPYGFERASAERFWRRIACPVLLVEGGASTFRLAPEDAAHRRACFAQLRAVTLDGAGHMMQRHRPVELARILAEFLAG